MISVPDDLTLSQSERDALSVLLHRRSILISHIPEKNEVEYPVLQGCSGVHP